jgi:6-phosphofructokinase 2
MKIVTLTMNPGLDKSARVKQVMPDDKLRCHSSRVEPGGGGINVSRAIQRLGGDSLAVYPRGGYNGDLLSDILSEENVSSETVPIERPNRMNLAFSEEKSDRQYRFVFPGPSLQTGEWKSCLERIKKVSRDAEFIVASGSLPPETPDDFYALLANVADEITVKLIIDARGTPLRKALQKPVFMIKPNVREFSQLCGTDLNDKGDIDRVAKDFLKNFELRHLVISLGSGGALWISENNHHYFRSPTVPIRSKVGAGDSMVAGIVLKLGLGENISTAIAYGVSAGAAAVTTPGSELCTKEKTDEFFEKIKNEIGD